MKDRGSELDSQYFADGQPPLLNHKAAYDVETIAHALTNIYRRNVDVDHDIEPYLYEETQRIMDEAIAEGYANAAENNIPTPDEAFRNAFSHSADVFSAFRVHKMQTDIAAQMLDSDGHLKPFSKFVKDVSPYIEHRNRAWLQTEYDTAIIRAQNAAEWQQFQAEKDVFPNLEWIPSTSPNPGADHQVFWGTVLPVDDPFWSEHKPGDRWNCKCELRQTDRDSTPVPSSDGKSDPAPGLESNPATDREPFSDRHPYYPSGCSSCPFAGNRLVALVHDLAGRGKHCNDCVKANQKIEKAENYKQWEQNKADYEKYNADPEYVVDKFRENGGFLAQHKSRIPAKGVSSNERKKYDKEVAMCEVLANNGYAVIYKKDVPGEFDVFVNRESSDLKQTKSHNNIGNYAKKAIEKQGGKYAVFCFEDKTARIIREVNNQWKLHQRKCLYYFKGENVVYKNWE